MWYSLLNLNQIAPDAIQALVTVDDTSPWFSGHFPESPILPGIAQLDMVADVIARNTGEQRHIQRLTRVKFKKIVSPGEQLEILATAMKTPNLYTFRITSEAQEVCSGTMLLAITQEPAVCP